MAGVIETIQSNRERAQRIAERIGSIRTRGMLREAEAELVERLQALTGTETFTEMRLQATLSQIRDILNGTVIPGIRDLSLGAVEETSQVAAKGTIAYLNAAERQYRGIGAQTLALDEAALTSAAVSGAKSSLLRRLASSGTAVRGADETPHPAKMGILQRYGMNTISHFEKILRTNVLARTSMEDTRMQLVDASPFLKGAPAYWSERIVRTETMGVYARANYEATIEADEQLGDIVKIVCATFDNRTGPDSWNQHGQVRKPSEPFQYVADNGDRDLYQHPPNRPNDREIVVTHRTSWPLPPTLRVVPVGRVQAQYAKAKRAFPGRPEPMSTVSGFGGG